MTQEAHDVPQIPQGIPKLPPTWQIHWQTATRRTAFIRQSIPPAQTHPALHFALCTRSQTVHEALHPTA